MLLNFIVDFFRNLGQQRIDSAVNSVNAKKMGVVTKAKTEASKRFNQALDKPTQAATAAAKAAVQGRGAGGQPANPPAKGDDVGWFSRKKDEPQRAPAPAAASASPAGDQTMALDLTQLNRGSFKPAVGWVVVLNGELRGRDFRLVDGKNTIGTAADCDVVLTDPYLSSKHAVIRHENGIFTLVDLDSTNGTFLNERKCAKDDLIDNDKIRLGRTELKFKSLE